MDDVDTPAERASHLGRLMALGPLLMSARQRRMLRDALSHARGRDRRRER